MHQNDRTIALLGEEAAERLRRGRVAVFGIGGVGGYVCEALARCGVGELTLFDHDTVSLTNLNRQMVALHSTLGQSKAAVMAARIADINPEIHVTAREMFYLPQNANEVNLSCFDYVVDCVDTVTAKLALIEGCEAAGVPLICAMGAGNKLDPTRLRVADIYETEACPLARILRKECRARGIKRLKVVYSTELPRRVSVAGEQVAGAPRRDTPASAIFVPAAMGLALASEVVRDLTGGCYGT